jgi:acetolactate synthase-1/2/3 large subunit
VGEDVLGAVAKLLASGEPCLFLLGANAARAAPMQNASRISNATGAIVLLETSIGRLERGGGLPQIERLNYRAGRAIRQLDGTRHLILVDAKSPVAFFAYPGKKSDLVPDGCEVHVLATGGEDADRALAELAEQVADGVEPSSAPLIRPELASGELTPQAIADTVAALLPEGAVVVDEGVTSGGYVQAATATGPRHDWLNVTGGAIGIGLPLAVGAAIAVPDRKVIGLQADGSTMYTIQALWTMARENLDTTTIIFNNRQYSILKSELKLVGAVGGPKALDMLDLSRPDLDFVALATGLGVPAERVTTAEELNAAFARGLASSGPHLIEAIL